MQIGAVAKKIVLSVDAIRFYEPSSLLPRPPRTQTGLCSWRPALRTRG
jgi:DNA-binding transcriptional MerR regulator